jgi:predicted Kef-type K+ transport protein
MEILFVFAAYIFGLVAQSIKLPPLVGYLVAGFTLAALGFGPTDNLKTVADLGVTILLFTVGLKIRFRNVLVKEIIGGGFIYTIVSTVLFAAIGFLLGYGMYGALYFGVMLSFSSTVFAAKVLDDSDDLGAYYGRIAIGILIIQDIFAVTLLGVSGMEKPSIWALSVLAIPLLIPLLARLLKRTGHGELMLVFGVLLALSGSWLFGAVGLSDKLGALIIGILIAEQEKAEELGKVLWGIKEMFLVAFFLQIGLLGLPDGKSILIVGLFLAVLPLKGLIYFFVLKIFGLRNRTAFWSSSVLFCYSEFGLIAGAGAVTAGLLSEKVLVMVALLVASSFVILGVANKWMSDIYDSFFAFLDKSRDESKLTDHLPTCIGTTKFLVVGMGSCGTSTYDFLKSEKQSVLGIDSDPNVIADHRKKGRRVIYGNAIDKSFWEKCDMNNIHGISICLPVTDEKITVVKKLRRLGFKNRIDSYCYFDDEAELLLNAGVSELVSPLKLTGKSLGQMISKSYNQGQNMVE